VLALLVVVSLILLTAYFGESTSSPLHSVQRGIVEVMSPIEDGASKVLSPVRDIAGWFSDTFNARSQVKTLRAQVQKLLAQNAELKQDAIENQTLSRELHFDTSDNINAYQPVSADVISRSATLWYQTIEVDEGSDDGVRDSDPVVGDGGLVGKVTVADPTVSIVTLLTDNTFAVTARVLPGGDEGVLAPDVGNPNELVLSDLPAPPAGQAGPSYGQDVVTAGFTDPSNPALQSLYPPGILIGTVSNANPNNLINNGQIQIQPAANLRTLSSVQILTAPHASSQRAQVTP
jgi:rod shape-determining protein MreC